jgi:hypothetical protein
MGDYRIGLATAGFLLEHPVCCSDRDRGTVPRSSIVVRKKGTKGGGTTWRRESGILSLSLSLSPSLGLLARARARGHGCLLSHGNGLSFAALWQARLTLEERERERVTL